MDVERGSELDVPMSTGTTRASYTSLQGSSDSQSRRYPNGCYETVAHAAEAVDPLHFANLLTISRGEPSTSLLGPARFLQAQLEAVVDDRARERFSAVLAADFCPQLNESTRVLKFLVAIATHFRESPKSSLKSAVRHFTTQKILKGELDPSNDTTACVFAGIGWITKLYTPDLRADGPLTIVKKKEPCFQDPQMDVKLAARSITELLRSLGGLLPVRSMAEAPVNIVQLASINYATLSQIGGIQIAWSDTLSAHLNFDPATSTLFLFRLPSFCVVHDTADTLLQS